MGTLALEYPDRYELVIRNEDNGASITINNVALHEIEFERVDAEEYVKKCLLGISLGR